MAESDIHKRAVVRVDGSKSIGFGHLVRSSNLLRELRKHGWEFKVLAAEPDTAVKKFLRQQELDLVPASSPPDKVDPGTHISLQNKFDSRIALLDSYGVSDGYRHQLKKAGMKIIAIDDIYRHYSHSDVVINHNLSCDPSRYKDFKGTLLSGPEYALIRPEFGKIKRKKRAIPNILIVMGGSDNKNQRSRIAKILDTLRWDFTITFVSGFYELENNKVGSGNKKLDLSGKTSWTHSCRFVGRSDDFPSVLTDCDAAVTAGGITAMEIAASGIPFLVLQTDEHQSANCNAWHKSGAGLFAGDVDELNNYEIKTAFTQFFETMKSWPEMGKSGKALVDGVGAARTAEKLTEIFFKKRERVAAK